MSSTPRVPREGMRSPQRGAGLVTRSATAADSARCAAAAHTTRFAAPRALRFPPAARHATRGVHSGTLSFTSPPQPGPPLARVTKAAAGGCLPAAATSGAGHGARRARGALQLQARVAAGCSRATCRQAGRHARTHAGRQVLRARAGIGVLPRGCRVSVSSGVLVLTCLAAAPATPGAAAHQQRRQGLSVAAPRRARAQALCLPRARQVCSSGAPGIALPRSTRARAR